MKNYKIIKLIFLLVFGLFAVAIQAQENEENTYIISQYFQLAKQGAINNNENVKPTLLQAQENYVQITQVGNNNVADVTKTTNDVQIIGQAGNNNYYQFINYYNSTPVNLNIQQNGNSNSLQIYGTNSLMKNFGVVQNGFKTVIIKNY